MDLWHVYAILSAGMGSAAMWVVAAACRPARTTLDVRMLERIALGRVLLPLLAGTAVVAFLTGWALREPNPADERVELGMCALATLAGLVVARTAWRALMALLPSRVRGGPVVTHGFWRCRVLVADEYRDAASCEVLRAALAHEAAHARCRDPLRIWLAQLATDLQWPVPGAGLRFQQWLLALEVRRDDDAVLAGASPSALAEGILLAARLQSRCPPASVASIAGDGTGLALRVRRLIEMREAPAAHPRRLLRCVPWVVLAALTAALLLGTRFGDLVLAALPGVQ